MEIRKVKGNHWLGLVNKQNRVIGDPSKCMLRDGFITENSGQISVVYLSSHFGAT